MKKKSTVTISREMFLTLMRLIVLAAYASNFTLNRIFSLCDVGTNKKYQGANFTHARGYGEIEKAAKELSEVMRILLDAIPTDGETVSELVGEISKNSEFKKLLTRYGADISDNFEDIS